MGFTSNHHSPNNYDLRLLRKNLPPPVPDWFSKNVYVAAHIAFMMNNAMAEL